MKGLITCLALLFATSGASYSTQKSQFVRKELLSTLSPMDSSAISTKESTSVSSSTEASSNASNADIAATSNLATEMSTVSTIALNPEIPAAVYPGAEEPLRRRIITYDQRQEGQYNIRAELENFMIVMVPQDPSLFSELFLMKTLRHRPSVSKEKPKVKNPFDVPNFLKLLEISQRTPTLGYNTRSHPLSLSGEGIGTKRTTDYVDGGGRLLPEFIEGRTPYHVDISSSGDEHSRIHPDRQVDVLPPPYPLAYQNLKPYHLEAEPTVIQALPPPELQSSHISGNFLETYNQLLATGLKSAAASEHSSRARDSNNNGPELGYYRLSRAIRSGNTLDSDRLNAINNVSPYASITRAPEMPIYRIEHSLGAASLYPPIDVPKTFGFSNLRKNYPRSNIQFFNTADAQEQDWVDKTNIDRVILPTLDITVPQDYIESQLHVLSLLDREAKTLLSDGIERCRSGYRRDSYGLCREIEGY